MIFDLIGFHKFFITMMNAIGVWLVLVVFLSNRDKRESKLFMLMTLSMIGWTNFALFARLIENPQLSLIILKIAWFVTPPFFLFIYLFTIRLVHISEKVKTLTYINTLLCIVLSLLTGFTNLVLEDRVIRYGLLAIQYGKAMWPFLLGITFLIGSVLYVLFSGWKSLSPEEKKALYPFLTGLAIFYVFNMIFNISLPIFFKITRFYFLGDYTTVVLTAMVAYSIVRHKFLGVKVVLSAFLISTIGLLLVIDTFLLSTTFWEQLFKGFIFVVFLLISFLLIKTLNTESKQKEELERLIKELEEKEKRMVFLTEMNDIKTSFLSLISHHLRTPLTPLIGYMEALKSDRSIPSGTKSALEGMDESVTKLRKLFEKIIHIASLQTDDEPLHFTSLDFTQLIHRVASERIVALTREKGLRLSLPNLTTSCIIEADEKLLEEALFNILENAVQFTDKGEITLTIQENKSKTCLSVQDTGKGMAETYQKQLFTLFARPKDTVFQFDQKGVGLGLYVSKLILEKHHGTIEIQSQLGKGTTCTICLPLTQK